MEERKKNRGILHLISIPSYHVDIFKHPERYPATPYETLHKSREIPQTGTMTPDHDVSLIEQQDGYVISLFATNRKCAKTIRDICNVISRTSGAGSTSPTHRLPADFSVTVQSEAVIIKGQLETLLVATDHLHKLNYISKEKHAALDKEISDILDSDSDSDTDTESSDNRSAETTPRHFI
jgi:hypothetical protein